MFSNLTVKEQALVQTTRLQAMAVQLVYIVRASNTSALALSDHFVSRAKAFERYVLFTCSILNFFKFSYLYWALKGKSNGDPIVCCECNRLPS